MMVVYLMGHTLAFPEDNKMDVLAAVRLADVPNSIPKFICPCLATGQLKFFFGVMRHQQLKFLLSRLHCILVYSAKGKAA
jgi:hypothetical protein